MPIRHMRQCIAAFSAKAIPIQMAVYRVASAPQPVHLPNIIQIHPHPTPKDLLVRQGLVRQGLIPQVHPRLDRPHGLVPMIRSQGDRETLRGNPATDTLRGPMRSRKGISGCGVGTTSTPSGGHDHVDRASRCQTISLFVYRRICCVDRTHGNQ
jgi:hypothetical protein